MTDALNSVGGVRIVSGSLSLHYYGLWTADFALATADAVGDVVQVAIGNLIAKGFVLRSAEFAGSRQVRLAGGMGGWRKTIPERSYSLAGGVPLTMVLTDAAKECGETIQLASPTLLAPDFVREKATGANLLRNYAGPLWWMELDGTTRVADDRAHNAIISQFDAIERAGGKGMFDVATESPVDWLPGNTFASLTIPDAQMIAMSTMTIGADGTLRVTVLVTQ